MFDPWVWIAAATLAGAAAAVSPSAALPAAAAILVLIYRRAARPSLALACVLLLAAQTARSARALDRARALHAAAVTALTPPSICWAEAEVISSPIASVRDPDPAAHDDAHAAHATIAQATDTAPAPNADPASGADPTPDPAPPAPTSVVYTRAAIRVHKGECDDRPIPEGLVARVYDLPEDLRRGDAIEITAKLAPVHLFEHAELPSPWPFIARSEIVASGAALDVLVTRRSLSAGAAIDRARAFIRRRILATYAPGAAGLGRALVLGETDLSEDDVGAFRDSGLLHLLAVSGTHLVLVVAALSGALRRLLLHIPPLAARTDVARPAAALGIAAAWLYADFAGGSGSAVRAAAMLSVALLAKTLARKPAPARALSVGLAAAALVDPLVGLDISFALSTGATCGLVLLAGPLSDRLTLWLRLQQAEAPEPGPNLDSARSTATNPKEKNTPTTTPPPAPACAHDRATTSAATPRTDDLESTPPLRSRARELATTAARHLVVSIATTLAATAGSAPAMLRLSPRLPLLGVLANLLAAPIGELLALPVCLAHAVTAPIAPLERALAMAGSGALLAVREIARTSASIGGNLPVRPPSPPQLAALAVACAAFAVARSRTHRLAIAAASTAALLLLEASHVHTAIPHGVLRVTALDVGQGDALLIDLPDGRSMLIDGGGMVGNPVDPGTRVILPVLAARRRSHVDVLVLTHPHPDHFTGLATVATSLPFTELWETGQGEAHGARGAYARLLEAARTRGAPLRRPADLCGHPRWFGAARVEVLRPCPRLDPDTPANDASLVVRIDFGDQSALLTGDSELDAEHEMLTSRAHLRATLLKVGHHGSRTSSSLAFLRAVAPETAMISCGVRNRFGHPHPAAMARLATTGATLLRTDQGGAIVWETDGRTATIRRP
ncbi:MAG: ComEC/Rec2 family competence protein [Polyangiaceae bacterium]